MTSTSKIIQNDIAALRSATGSPFGKIPNTEIIRCGTQLYGQIIHKEVVAVKIPKTLPSPALRITVTKIPTFFDNHIFAVILMKYFERTDLVFKYLQY